LKRLVLIGDSIRLGYAPYVVQALAGEYEVISPAANGGTSANVLAHLEEWAVDPRPDVVHLNCGLHDIRREFASGARAVEPDAYRCNLDEILSRLVQSGAAVVLATTTPVNYARHHANKGFDRFEEDVQEYNGILRDVARRHGVRINDLYSIIMDAGRDDLLLPDGVHFSPEGYRLLGQEVARVVRDLR